MFEKLIDLIVVAVGFLYDSVLWLITKYHQIAHRFLFGKYADSIEFMLVVIVIELVGILLVVVNVVA